MTDEKLPNPAEWMTVLGAAGLLGVSRSTVERMVRTGVLTAHRPMCGGSERAPVMLWIWQVDALWCARRRVAPRRREPGDLSMLHPACVETTSCGQTERTWACAKHCPVPA
jgi:excisionase family DNA binding protein